MNDDDPPAPNLRDIRRILVENLSACAPTLVRPGTAPDLHWNVGRHTPQTVRKETGDE